MIINVHGGTYWTHTGINVHDHSPLCFCQSSQTRLASLSPRPCFLFADRILIALLRLHLCQTTSLSQKLHWVVLCSSVPCLFPHCIRVDNLQLTPLFCSHIDNWNLFFHINHIHPLHSKMYTYPHTTIQIGEKFEAVNHLVGDEARIFNFDSAFQLLDNCSF